MEQNDIELNKIVILEKFQANLMIEYEWDYDRRYNYQISLSNFYMKTYRVSKFNLGTSNFGKYKDLFIDYGNILYSLSINNNGLIEIPIDDFPKVEKIITLAYFELIKYTSNDYIFKSYVLNRDSCHFNNYKDILTYFWKNLKDIKILALNMKNKKLEENNEKLKQEVTGLEQRVDKLENIINDMLYWSPNGPGYEKAEEEFDKLK